MTNYRVETFRVKVAAIGDGRITYKLGDQVAAVRFARSVFAALDCDKENFVVVCLNNKNRVIGFKLVSIGSLTAALVCPREVYLAAFRLQTEAQPAASLLFVHNHPSGEPQPSQEDIEITRRLKEAGELLGFRVLDHIVLGESAYFSFAERGML